MYTRFTWLIAAYKSRTTIHKFARCVQPGPEAAPGLDAAAEAAGALEAGLPNKTAAHDNASLAQIRKGLADQAAPVTGTLPAHVRHNVSC